LFILFFFAVEFRLQKFISNNCLHLGQTNQPFLRGEQKNIESWWDQLEVKRPVKLYNDGQKFRTSKELYLYLLEHEKSGKAKWSSRRTGGGNTEEELNQLKLAQLVEYVRFLCIPCMVLFHY